MLDGLEEYASDRLSGLELGDIEWFHRVRNQLYHDGNGITVEKEKVEAYAEIAKILFENLFELIIEENGNEVLHHSLVGEFIKLWADLERTETTIDGRSRPAMHRLRQLLSDDTLSEKQAEKFNVVRQFKNNLVHGMSSPSEAELKESVKDLKKLVSAININE